MCKINQVSENWRNDIKHNNFNKNNIIKKIWHLPNQIEKSNNFLLEDQYSVQDTDG